MSFREKSAWISFVCLLLLTLGVVFSLHVHTNNGPGYDAASQLHLALATFVGFLVLQLVLHLIVAARSPKDARTPKDERERFIELRAARIGFYSLVVGELGAMALMHVHGRPGILMWSILLAIFIAWLIKLGSEIVLYRRG
jgi:4-amino-4-deoxy-L-arabinose transferase-like glycosyltransferase